MSADGDATVHILIVDDLPANLEILEALLIQQGYQVYPALSGQQALDLARQQPMDLILLDIMMPHMDGYQVCQRLKADPHLMDIPVIFVSAMNELADKVHGFKVGGVDYITRPFKKEEVAARIATHLELARLRKRDKEYIYRLRHESEKREHSEARYRELFNTVPVGLYRTSPDGQILDANPTLIDMLGYSSLEELRTRHVGDGYANVAERVRFQHLIEASGTVRGMEVCWKKRDGTPIWVLENSHGVYDGTGQLIYYEGSAEDITERRRAEEAQKQAQIAAEAANRAKSVFLANMSHELRTPLNAILGFTQLMERSDLPQSQRENLAIVNRSGKHLLRLINDILEIAKVESGRIELQVDNFDLHRTLDSLIDMLRVRAEQKNITLEAHYTTDVPRFIRGDEGKLRQILINLIGNAIKFTEKGYVTLRVKYAGMENNHLILQFQVEDTGPGIKEEELELLFQPFTRITSGRKTEEGTGLGLAIDRQYIELMNGQISVESTPGKGSIFTFTVQAQVAGNVIPTHQKSEKRVIGLAPEQPVSRLLIVDDAPEHRLFLRKLLKLIGFAVQEADNGQEALRVASEWQPHLVFVDLRMPGMNGCEVARRLKKSGDKAPLVVGLTASVFEFERESQCQQFFDDVLYKPFQESDLFNLLSRFLKITYLYEEPSSAEDNGLQHDSDVPERLLWQLHRAAREADPDKVLVAIRLIASYDRNLAEKAHALADTFQFDKIMALCQK